MSKKLVLAVVLLLATGCNGKRSYTESTIRVYSGGQIVREEVRFEQVYCNDSRVWYYDDAGYSHVFYGEITVDKRTIER